MELTRLAKKRQLVQAYKRKGDHRCITHMDSAIELSIFLPYFKLLLRLDSTLYTCICIIIMAMLCVLINGKSLRSESDDII